MISSAEVGAVARNLADAGSDLRWSGEGLRELAGRLGWEWADGSDGRVRLVTALPGGDAALVPVDARARPWARSQEYLELVVPVSRPAAEVHAQVEEFRRVADALRRELGNATYIGGNGRNSPTGHRLAPSWGRPFLRWRRGATSLELRAGEAGPELVLQASAVWESWYQQGGDGYVGVLQGAGLELDHPRREYAGEWDELALGGFLQMLPAEVRATGLAQSMPLYGCSIGDGPLLFAIDCRAGRLLIGYTEAGVAEAARGERAATLGWTPIEETLPSDHPLRPQFGCTPWLIDAGGPGGVDGAVADVIVRTARAAGVASASGLRIGGEAEHVVIEGTTGHTRYRIGFPGLRMRTC
ncbi:hypothetical protein ACFVSN_00605 [Kitasatospora sp. NPDC057904]|uniref:hypothetical protein n=1 Tax=unclassified Kitasatospora TaxID=2633591 RepID=UPI0036DD6760